MSKVYGLIQLNNSGILTLDKESINFLKEINDEIIMVCFLSSTNENDENNEVKLKLISNLSNDNIEDNYDKGASLL